MGIKKDSGVIKIFREYSSLTFSKPAEVDLFNSFLKSSFSNELTFEQAILNLVNSGEWGRDITLKKVWKVEDSIKDPLTERIQNYFKDFKYNIFIIIDEENSYTDNLNYLSIKIGEEEPLPSGSVLPTLIIPHSPKNIEIYFVRSG